MVGTSLDDNDVGSVDTVTCDCEWPVPGFASAPVRSGPRPPSHTPPPDSHSSHSSHPKPSLLTTGGLVAAIVVETNSTSGYINQLGIKCYDPKRTPDTTWPAAANVYYVWSSDPAVEATATISTPAAFFSGTTGVATLYANVSALGIAALDKVQGALTETLACVTPESEKITGFTIEKDGFGNIM